MHTSLVITTSVEVGKQWLLSIISSTKKFNVKMSV